jgi:hypothetical protein
MTPSAAKPMTIAPTVRRASFGPRTASAGHPARIAAPHEEQNFAPSRSSALHSGHNIVGALPGVS